MKHTKITKKVLRAVDRILRDGRSIDAMRNGQIPTAEGFALTDGFVLVHSPVSLTEQRCKAKDLDTTGGGTS